MPIIKSAKKKLRQDKKRQIENKKVRELLKKTIKEAGKNVTDKTVREAFSIIDKSAKIHLIHKNKAAHLKSALSKKLALKHPKAKADAKPKPAAAKTAPKLKKTTKKTSKK